MPSLVAQPYWGSNPNLKTLCSRMNTVNYLSVWMWLFHRLVCQSFVIFSVSSGVGFPVTVTKTIKVLPFLDSFSMLSGSLPLIWRKKRKATIRMVFAYFQNKIIHGDSNKKIEQHWHTWRIVRRFLKIISTNQGTTNVHG